MIVRGDPMYRFRLARRPRSRCAWAWLTMGRWAELAAEAYQAGWTLSAPQLSGRTGSGYFTARFNGGSVRVRVADHSSAAWNREPGERWDVRPWAPDQLEALVNRFRAVATSTAVRDTRSGATRGAPTPTTSPPTRERASEATG